ncbi:expressed unknown protein [Seminavis robusta]|uniref:Uncharacterized protein n=1 Tax=Seminavis robusta TaxID=568900 RepID=A0A9N8EMR1_9STRA|nr:expressed unknown protein [Seminavis robusta]|eukprot:Sro1244_g255610.1 n/a (173) ;mRNA; r:25532-26050
MKIATFTLSSLCIAILASATPALARLSDGSAVQPPFPDNRGSIMMKDCPGLPHGDDVNYILPPEHQCLTTEGTAGVWGCRPEPMMHSTCLISYQGTVVGKQGDTCGCCGGVCPSLCLCPCEGGGVLVHETIFWGLKRKKCLQPGLAEAMVLQDDSMTCFTGCQRASGLDNLV